MRHRRIDYLAEAMKTKTTVASQSSKGVQRRMSNATEFQIRQVYGVQDMTRIFGISESAIYEAGKSGRTIYGVRIPTSIELPGAVVRWRKRQVWKALEINVDPKLVTIKTGDVVRSPEAAKFLSVSEMTINRWIHEGHLKSLRMGHAFVVSMESLFPWIGGDPLIWPKEGDDPAFTAMDERKKAAQPTEEPVVSGLDRKEFEKDANWKVLRQMIQDAIDETWMDRRVDVYDSSKMEMSKDVRQCVREELQALRDALLDQMPIVMREEMHSLFRNKKVQVELGQLTYEALLAAIGAEVRESVGRSMTSNAQEVVLSDRDVERMTQGFEAVFRRFAAARPIIDVASATPPTTNLRDRVRGTIPQNGR